MSPADRLRALNELRGQPDDVDPSALRVTFALLPEDDRRQLLEELLRIEGEAQRLPPRLDDVEAADEMGEAVVRALSVEAFGRVRRSGRSRFPRTLAAVEEWTRRAVQAGAAKMAETTAAAMAASKIADAEARVRRLAVELEAARAAQRPPGALPAASAM